MINRVSYILKTFLVFFAAIFLIQIYGWWSASISPSIGLSGKSAYFNLIYTFRSFSIIGLLMFLLQFVNLRLAGIVGVALSAIVLLIHFLLVSYQVQTGILLGADFYGYSLADIKETVSASGSINLTGILVLVLLIAFNLFLFWLLRKLKITKLAFAYALILAGLICWLLPSQAKISDFNNESAYSFVENPSTYFWNKSYTHFNIEDIPIETEIADYPFLHETDQANPLGKWMAKAEINPNIVIIAVEGLGSQFVGRTSEYGGFTPFLDSLIDKSLYWENCLSNTGRTFGVLPTILGSLPYSGSGFMNQGLDMPSHFTLFSWLKQQGYYTSYFYGGNSNFDNQDIFLERQQTDYFLDEGKFPVNYQKMQANDEGFSWGYGDREVFDFSLTKLKGLENRSKISFYMTLTTHEPFKSPDPAFDKKAMTLINDKIKNGQIRNTKLYEENANIFSCLMYTDDAIGQFIKAYSDKPDFKNTIFIITGDHRMIPIPTASRINRFNVPLIIYSPMLNTNFKSEQIVSHSQLAPTILSYLHNSYSMPAPQETAFISPTLSESKAFGSGLDLALMRNKNELEEYVEGLYLLSSNELYKIEPKLKVTPVNNAEIKSRLQRKLRDFKAKSEIAITQNRLIPPDLEISKPVKGFQFSENEITFLTENNLINRAPDTLLFEAQKLAFAKNYEASALVLKYGLNKSPNYHDMRILLARTFAWSGAFDSAFLYLDETLRRAEKYEDAYLAYSDAAYWKGDLELSNQKTLEGIKDYPANMDLKARLARNYLSENKKDEAKKLIDEILEINPNHEFALSIKSRIK